jgi:prepilin-type N-terminal cleavage/methylation domain-containing protein
MKGRPMRSSRSLRLRDGFTLIEIVIVVAIMGILAALGVSAFRAQLMKARRAEATIGLGSIHRAQLTYKFSNGYYGDSFDEIGFALDGAQRLDEHTIQGRTYTFTLNAIPKDGHPQGNFQAIATGDLDPSDGVLDILMLEDGLTASP